MKCGCKFLFILVSLFIILELTHCTDEEGKHEIEKGPVHVPKNRYIVEKTQNVTEKRETVPRTVDDGFQESFRKVRKIHKKLVNKKLSQYDETEDLERKRIKDSEDAQKKNIEEVQHVIQKMKIVENPSYPADKQNVEELKTTTSEQKQKTADNSETQKKIISSETTKQNESIVEKDKEKVVKVPLPTETKTKSITDSEIVQEEESNKPEPPNTDHQKTITSPERKGKKVIRTIYVTEGKNTHLEGEEDNLEAEYAKLKDSGPVTTSHEKDAVAETEKRTKVIETEEKSGESKKPLPQQKKSTEIVEEKSTESDEVKPSLESEPKVTVRRIIIRRPVKIIRKNITRSAKEEEQKENRSEEETFVDSEIRTVPIRRKKKITTSETEKDQSKNLVEGTEDSETIVEKPEGPESVKHIKIKRTRTGKDTKRSDKTNTEDVEIITDSEEPTFESKITRVPKQKGITRKITTETKENEADSENIAQKNRKKTVNVIDNVELDADKSTMKRNVNENEVVDVSVDKGKGKHNAEKYAEEEKVEVHTEKIEPQPTELLETEIVGKTIPNERKATKVSKTVTVNEAETDDKNDVKPSKVRITKKRTEDKHGRATGKSKSIIEVEEEIRQILASETDKSKGSQKRKPSKGKKKTVIVTNKLEKGSETLEDHQKHPDAHITIVESADKAGPVLKEKNKIVTSEIKEDDVTKTKHLEKVEITTTAPRIIVKDKVLTKAKVEEEDAYILKPYLEKLKDEDSAESGDIHKTQYEVVKKPVKPEKSKDGTEIIETDDKDKISTLKEKNLIKSDIQKGSIQVTETETDKKTNVVQDIIEPHSTTVKTISLIEPEVHKKEIETGVNKQSVKTDETNVIKTPGIVAKKVIVQNEIKKDAEVVSETRSKIKPSDEADTHTSVVVKKTTGDTHKKDNEITEIDHETKKHEDETEVIDKTGKLPGSRPKVTKKIITTRTVSETQNEHDDIKLDSKDEKEKPALESEGVSGTSTITVKKISKKVPETHAVPEIYPEVDKVEPGKEIVKVPKSNTLNVKTVRKIDSETLKEDEIAETKTADLKPIKGKSPESSTVTVERVKKIDTETIKKDTEIDTKTHEAKSIKEPVTHPETSSIIVKDVKKVDLHTKKDEVESKTNELVKSPESKTVTVKRVKNIDSETENEEADLDTKTKTHGVKTTKETGKTDESNTVIVKKEKKIDSETKIDDSKTHGIEAIKETEKVPESKAVIVKTTRKIDSEREKDTSDVFEVDAKGKAPSDAVKPIKEIGAVVKKLKATDSENHKEATDLVDSEAKVKSSEVRPSKDVEDSRKIRNIIVETMRKSDSETEKEGADDSEVNTTIKKHTADVKTDDKLEKLPESSTSTKKKIVTKSEIEDTELSDNDLKLKKQPGHIEVTETKKVIHSDKERIKDSQVDNIKEKQHIISEQAEKDRNRETVVSSKMVDSAIEKEDSKKKTEDIHVTNQHKGDKVVITSHTKTSGQEVEEEQDIKKGKHFGDVTKITQTITSESEKDNVNTEKKHLVASEDKEKKNEAVIIKSKSVSAPEQISVTSEQGKAKTKAQEDKEELVEKDEIITDTQIIEEEVDDESVSSQNVDAASKKGSKSITKVVKSGAQSQNKVLSKDRAAKHVTTGKVTPGKKSMTPKYSRRTLRGSTLKGREATEYLFLLENDAESTGPKDPSVAAELMSKLKVSKTKTYTTYHVNRGKQWSTNDDLSALILRLQVSGSRIKSVRNVTVPYMEAIQELQKISSKYIQDGYQASVGTQVKLQIKQFEKLQNAYITVETSLQSEAKELTELAIKAICEIRSGMFKMECFKEQYPFFEKFLVPAEPDKKDCYGNVRKLSEWAKTAPELWKNKERRLNKLQTSLDNLKKGKEELKPGQNLKKSIAGLLCDIFNYIDVQTKYLNFSANLEGTAKLARREINICNKKEPIDPALADAEK